MDKFTNCKKGESSSRPTTPATFMDSILKVLCIAYAFAYGVATKIFSVSITLATKILDTMKVDRKYAKATVVTVMAIGLIALFANETFATGVIRLMFVGLTLAMRIAVFAAILFGVKQLAARCHSTPSSDAVGDREVDEQNPRQNE